MGFTKRDVKDRVVQYPRRYRLVPVTGQEDIYDLSPVTGTVTEPGTPVNKAYLQPIEDNLQDIDGRVEDIEDGTKATVAVKLKTARQINGVAFDGTQNITVTDSTKAPTNHASSSIAYGIGIREQYGHVAVIDDLNGGYGAGHVLHANMGKALNDKLKYTVATITASGNWTVPAGVTALDIIAIDGGGGGGGGSCNWGTGSNSYTGESGIGGSSGAVKGGRFSSQPGTILHITIGSGGIGANGAASGSNDIPPTLGGGTSIAEITLPTIIPSIAGGDTVNARQAQPVIVGKAGVTQSIINTIGMIYASSGGSGGTGATDSSGTNSTGANGGAGGIGAGAGGKGANWSTSPGAAGANATSYGCGGGGGGSPSAYSGTVINNTNGKGGNGRQGVVYIGYYGF